MRLLPYCLAALLAAPALAEVPNLSAEPVAVPGPAIQLALAQRLQDHALRENDLVLLLAAIRIARGVTLRPAPGWVKAQSDTPPADAPQGYAPALDPAGPEALSLAQAMAGEDPALQDLAYDLDAQLPRTRRGTAAGAMSDLAAGGTDVWRIAFFGESPAELALIGDGDGPLELTVTDDAANLVCADLSSQPVKTCAFTPARNGFFTVTVTNRGAVVNSYRLVGSG